MSKLYRDYGSALLMLSASLVLVFVLLGEWLYFHSERTDLNARLTVKEPVSPVTDAGEMADVTLGDLQQYTELTARPLFMEGRRPPPEDEQAAAQSAPMESRPLNLKLMGVVFTPKDKSALFVDEKGKYHRVRRNAVVDGWKLAEVREDRVVMEQADGQRELPLIKSKPKAAASPPSPGKVTVRPPGQPARANDDQEGDEGDDADEADVSDESDEMSDESADDSSESEEGSDGQEE